MFKLRVHIAPVGFERDRVVQPILKMKADKVWLLYEKDPKRDQAKPFREKVLAILKKKGIQCKLAACTIDDLYDVLHVIKKVIDDEKKNELFINVSTGTKIEAIAGMMAAMIFKNGTSIVPYYAVPERYETQEKPMSYGLKETIQLPDYRITLPDPELIKALAIIAEKEEGFKKKNLIERFQKDELISVGPKAKFPASSLHMSINKKYLERLIELDLIISEGTGRKRKIKITPQGKNMLKFLS